jgi:acetoin utilization protein AcuC
MIYLYYTDGFMTYNFGPEHPLQPGRLMLAHRLMEEFGFFYEPDTEVVQPSFASEQDLLSVHEREYVEAVKAEMEDLAFGLGEDDTPVFPGIYDASRLIAGSSIEAAERMIKEECCAFNLGGGLHHAFPTRAAGFCVFNDVALAIAALKRRFERVLYIDIDAHHGDGVQQIFYEDPQVLTISLHESGKYLFPGTGFIDELGSGAGHGYSVNIPMPIFAHDEVYRYAFDEIVPELFKWFKPDAVVAQLGADTHYSDPLTSLNLTLSGYSYLVQNIKDLTDDHGNGRLLALGGGGYNMEVVPLAWSLAFQILRGKAMPEELPSWWVDSIMRSVGRPPLSLPDIKIKVDRGDKEKAMAEVQETIKGLKSSLSEIHGIF